MAEEGGQRVPTPAGFTKKSPLSASPPGVDARVPPPADPLVDHIADNLVKLPLGGGARLLTLLANGPSIPRVPPTIRDQESEAYEPRLVSIGPLHRGKTSLLPMEELKLSYLRDLLGRSPDNRLDNYVGVIRECEHRARAQYGELVVLNKDEFAAMLLLDGCFIIEYFVKRVFRQTAETAMLSGVRWGFAHLRRDLMLLENQIPFFVLVKLFEHSEIPFRGTRKEPLTLMELSLRFLDINLPMKEQPQADEVLHLLHLYHMCLDPSRVLEQPSRYSCGQVMLYPLERAADMISLLFYGLLYLVLIRKWPYLSLPGKKDSAAPRMINCAAELVETGIQFKKKDFDKETVNCFIRASFREGRLEIPLLKVEESTSSRLRNLIALEQCCPYVGCYFTSYGVLMDNIINTEGDVAILRDAGIIESKLGSDAEVADMFNALCKGTHLKYDTHYNAPLFRAVKGYCEFAHRRWRAVLVRKYFSSPWTIISLLAGCLLLALTAAQTYFTIFPRR